MHAYVNILKKQKILKARSQPTVEPVLEPAPKPVVETLVGLLLASVVYLH